MIHSEKKNIYIFLLVPVVRGVKNNLLHTLAACKTQNCKQVLHDYKVNQMSVQVDFDKVFVRFSCVLVVNIYTSSI